MSFTSNVITDERNTPKEPYRFGKDIQHSQERDKMWDQHRILYNKGKYFETSIYNKKILDQLCELTGFKPQYENMIVQNWRDMEDFVIAMNIIGIYVEIEIDWI